MRKPRTFKEYVNVTGMKQTDLARILGVSNALISHVLSGKSGISKKLALKIKDAFGLSLDDLLSE